MAEGRSRLLALLALPSSASDPSAEAAALVAIGHLCTRFAGELGAARSYAERGLTLARQIADRPGLRFEAARCLGWAILWEVGDPASADQLFQESLEAAREVGPTPVARALATLAWARVLQGHLAAGRALIEESVARFRALGDWLNVGVQLCYLADVDIREGRYDDARQHAREALENTHLVLPLTASWGRILDVFIRLAAAEHHPQRVIRLAGAVSMVRPVVGISPLTSPELVELARRELGDASSAELWAAGRAMTVDEIVAIALSTPAADGQSGETATGDASGLTEREQQVLHLLVEGKSNKEIGETLVLSVRTVERHIANLYSKIGAHGRVEATGYAFRHGVT
jgi:ATP/maltotriose-dependent transcriptional regulator MalT